MAVRGRPTPPSHTCPQPLWSGTAPTAPTASSDALCRVTAAFSATSQARNPLRAVLLSTMLRDYYPNFNTMLPPSHSTVGASAAPPRLPAAAAAAAVVPAGPRRGEGPAGAAAHPAAGAPSHRKDGAQAVLRPGEVPVWGSLQGEALRLLVSEHVVGGVVQCRHPDTCVAVIAKVREPVSPAFSCASRGMRTMVWRVWFCAARLGRGCGGGGVASALPGRPSTSWPHDLVCAGRGTDVGPRIHSRVM